MSTAEPAPARRRPRAWMWLTLGVVVAAALAADPWGWWRDDQWFFDGPERVDRWSKKRDAAQAEWHRHLVAEAEGPNAGPVLAAAGAVASLVRAEWQGEDWSRVVDEDLDDDTLAAMRELTERADVRYLLELLHRNRDIDYIHYAWMHHPGTLRYASPPANGLERFPGSLNLSRVLTARAAVLASDGEFDRAYETLALGLVAARWTVREQPTMLNGLLAASMVRDGLRNIEELSGRKAPSQQVELNLRNDIERVAQALDIESIIKGEIAFQEWVYTEEIDIWDPEPNVLRLPLTRMLEAVSDPPWKRDDEALAKAWDMPIPEQISNIDSIIESQFRARLTLEVMRLLRGGVPDLESDVWTDPFTGEPLLVRENGERCTVYSVGRDREDNGGVDRRSRTPYWDVVWRLPCELVPRPMYASAGDPKGDRT